MSAKKSTKRRLKPLGGKLPDNRRSLDDVISDLAWLISDEEDSGVCPYAKTPKGRRLSKVFDALELLQEVVLL